MGESETGPLPTHPVGETLQRVPRPRERGKREVGGLIWREIIEMNEEKQGGGGYFLKRNV